MENEDHHPLHDDSDTGLESMSSTDLHTNTAHFGNLGHHHPQSSRNSCNCCPEQDDQKRLDELVLSMERLKNEKTDLLQQNVTCKTDIKKLKQRQSMLSTELDKANDEIQRLRRMLKRPSNSSDSSSGTSGCFSHNDKQTDRPAVDEDYHHVIAP
jgi:septal ring factor EnvC (AmiA/AmiB activator)